MAPERQKRRTAIVESAGVAGRAFKRGVIGDDGLRELIKALQKVAAIDQRLDEMRVETNRLIEKFQRVRAMVEIAQDEGARPQGLRIGWIKP